MDPDALKKLPITVMIDCERSFRSVSHLIRSETNPNGRVIRVKAHLKAKALDTAGELLLRKKLPQWDGGPLLTAQDYDDIEIISIDTLSHAADVARRELTGIHALGTIWDSRKSLTTDQRDWGVMTDYLARAVEGIVSYCDDNHKRLLLLSHQRSVEEVKDMPKIVTLDFNAKLLNEVGANSDYVWRMWREDKGLKVGDTLYPKGTHFLKMTSSENKATKMRLPYMYTDSLPDNLPNPTLGKIFEILRGFGEEFIPLVATIFGPWGCGKTTLACSLSDPNALVQGVPKAKPKLTLAT